MAHAQILTAIFSSKSYSYTKDSSVAFVLYIRETR